MLGRKSFSNLPNDAASSLRDPHQKGHDPTLVGLHDARLSFLLSVQLPPMAAVLQVPQYILEQAVEARRGAAVGIVCTQPRRIAAISVAERVAAERGESCGGSVAYQVRFDEECLLPWIYCLGSTALDLLPWISDL